jgi:hypothetical protein
MLLFCDHSVDKGFERVEDLLVDLFDELLFFDSND